MAEFKLTKNELKFQKNRLDQLQKYLPTLQLKKALLQAEVLNARHEKMEFAQKEEESTQKLEEASPLLSIDLPFSMEEAVSIEKIDVESENIAGAELPKLKNIIFQPFQYDLYTTPLWSNGLIQLVQKTIQAKISLEYANKRLGLLEKEFREVSIRVNLFDKVLIPRCLDIIKKIKIFLADMQLSQVCQAKVAKAKIMKKKAKQSPTAETENYNES